MDIISQRIRKEETEGIMYKSEELTNAHNRLSTETYKIMSSLFEENLTFEKNRQNNIAAMPVRKQQSLGGKNSGKRRLSLPKLKEPSPLTPDGSDLIDEKSTNMRRLSYF